MFLAMGDIKVHVTCPEFGAVVITCWVDEWSTCNLHALLNWAVVLTCNCVMGWVVYVPGIWNALAGPQKKTVY